MSPTSTSVKLAGGNREAEARVLIGGLVGNDGRGDGAIIGIVDRNGEVLRGGGACGVGCGDADGQAPRHRRSEGVPEKVWVAGSKLSQAGSGLPSARVADRVSVSPTSTSLKLSGGNREAEAGILIGGLVGNDGRGDGSIIGIDDRNVEVLGGGGPGGVSCGDADGERAHIIVQRRAGEGLGDRIEAEPGGQAGCRRQGWLTG